MSKHIQHLALNSSQGQTDEKEKLTNIIKHAFVFFWKCKCIYVCFFKDLLLKIQPITMLTWSIQPWDFPYSCLKHRLAAQISAANVAIYFFLYLLLLLLFSLLSYFGMMDHSIECSDLHWIGPSNCRAGKWSETSCGADLYTLECQSPVTHSVSVIKSGSLYPKEKWRNVGRGKKLPEYHLMLPSLPPLLICQQGFSQSYLCCTKMN